MSRFCTFAASGTLLRPRPMGFSIDGMASKKYFLDEAIVRMFLRAPSVLWGSV